MLTNSIKVIPSFPFLSPFEPLIGIINENLKVTGINFNTQENY